MAAIKPQYIALEGVDTSGKTTQIEILKLTYKDVIFTKEPGGTKFGDYVQRLVEGYNMCKEAEWLLFLADRVEHINEIIIPNKDKLIISDRSCVSGMAYAQNINDNLNQQMNQWVTKQHLPDMVFILWMQEEELQKRLDKKQQQDKIEKRGVPYLLAVQQRLKQSCELLNIPYTIINAGLEMPLITKEIENYINERNIAPKSDGKKPDGQ